MTSLNRLDDNDYLANGWTNGRNFSNDFSHHEDWHTLPVLAFEDLFRPTTGLTLSKPRPKSTLIDIEDLNLRYEDVVFRNNQTYPWWEGRVVDGEGVDSRDFIKDMTIQIVTGTKVLFPFRGKKFVTFEPSLELVTALLPKFHDQKVKTEFVVTQENVKFVVRSDEDASKGVLMAQFPIDNPINEVERKALDILLQAK